jgi:hypothetical protein
MLATELLFVWVCCLIDDAIKAGALAIPPRRGPVPRCNDAELSPSRGCGTCWAGAARAASRPRSRRDWPGLFPQLPPEPEVNRRIRWLWGASGQLRATLAARLPDDDCQQVDTSPLSVKHTSRGRGPDLARATT